jgi:hypothetical protein
MTGSMPYVLMVLAFFALYLFGNSSSLERKESTISGIWLIAVFFCFRGYIFTDVFNYKKFFDSVPDLYTAISTDFIKETWWEPGFVYYCCLIKTFTGNYLVFQAIDTVVDLILFYKGLEWFRANNGLTYMIFLAMNGLILFVDAMRNVKSILIFIIALRYVYDRRLVKYYLCCAIAMCFHVSSIVYFPFYFVLYRRFRRSTFAAIFLVSIVFFFFSSQVFLAFFTSLSPLMPGRLGEMVQQYVLNSSAMSEQRTLSLGLIEKIVTFCAVFTLYGSLYRDKNVLIVNSFLAYFSLYFVFSGFYEVSNRLSILFIFSYWILWPQFIGLIRDRNVKAIGLMVTLTYCILKCSLYSKPYQEYENVLFGAKSYYQRMYLLETNTEDDK